MVARIRAIVDDIDGMLRDYAASLDPVEVKPVQFTCSRCGACCKRFVPGVSIADVRAWVDSCDPFLLAFLVFHEDRHSFRFLSKIECLAMLDACSDEVKAWLHAIVPEIPSLDECVFLTRDGTCGIHDGKPIECRLYPVGNIVQGSGDVVCDPGCFESPGAEGASTDDIRSLLEVKRVVDHGIAAILAIEGPGGTWAGRFSTLRDLFLALRTADDEA